ncbi:MAG: TolB family protein, partial [Candidatus Methylomirabilaceae bacterium]
MATRPIRLLLAALAGSAVLFAATRCVGGESFGPDPGTGELVYASNPVLGQFDVFVLNLDDGLVRRLTDTLAYDFWPAWSPDGARIAFESDRSLNLDIYVMHVDSIAARQLTTHPMADIQPAWSPDGAKIAFASDRDGDYEIHVVNADGTGLLQLTTSDSADDGHPAWSPDGTRIAFVSDSGGNTDILVMSAVDGSNRTNLTNNPARDLS